MEANEQTVVELTFEKFSKLVAELLGIEAELIAEDANIYNDIGIDSLGLVSLGVKIQDRFDIQISAAELIEVRTVGEFYQTIKRYVDQV